MFGRRIFGNHSDDDEDGDSFDDSIYGAPIAGPSSRPVSLTSNLRRKAHRNSLRIITENHSHLSTRALRELTNMSSRRLSEAVYTPDTCNTFGVPNVTHRQSVSTNNIPNSVILSARRHLRYESAEKSLTACSKSKRLELTPEELKVRALEIAAATLSASARDAKENAVQIRDRLADRTMDPKQFRSLQDERWKEEHRQKVMEGRAQVAKKVLGSLSNGVQPQEPCIERRKANLAHFLDHSLSKAAFESNGLPKFHTKRIQRVTPLQLHPPEIPRATIQPFTMRTPLASHEPLYARRNQRQQSIETVVAAPTLTPAPSLLFASPTNPGLSSASSLHTISDDVAELAVTDSGYVSIYSPTFYATRSRADILAEIGDVPIPEYARDLLGDLDYIYDDIPLKASPNRAACPKMTFFGTRASLSDDDECTPTRVTPSSKRSFITPSKASFATSPATTSLFPVSESSPANSPPTSMGKRKGRARGASLGSMFSRENLLAIGSKDRLSLHVPTSSEKPSHSRRLLRKKSKSNALTTQSSEMLTNATPTKAGVRRGPSIAERIKRPFSMFGRH